MKPLQSIKTLALSTALAIAMAAGAQAGSLENLERERAILIDTLFAPDMTPDERHKKIARIRDKSLEGRNTPVVRRAFASYDLTFLVHASVEKGRSLTDHWLDTMGLSTDSLMNARIGRRY